MNAENKPEELITRWNSLPDSLQGMEIDINKSLWKLANSLSMVGALYREWGFETEAAAKLARDQFVDDFDTIVTNDPESIPITIQQGFSQLGYVMERRAER